MPTYLDNYSFANLYQQPLANRVNNNQSFSPPTSSGLTSSSPTCRQIYDHLQTCPLCQQATKNTGLPNLTSFSETNNTTKPLQPPLPLLTSWSVEVNLVTVGVLLILVLVIYLAFRK